MGDEERREQPVKLASIVRLGFEFPALSILIVLSSVGFLLGTYAFSSVAVLSFDSLEAGSFWRLITPIFLHFGLMHFIFNMFWLIYFGSKLERGTGSIQLFLLVIVIGLLSNISQYLWSGSDQFGGMSGSIYGLLGYLYAYHKVIPKAIYFVPPELFWFMLGWLIFCASGILEILVGIRVANASHLCGLIVGSLLGIIFGLLQFDRNLK